MPTHVRDADLYVMSSVARVRRHGSPVVLGLLVALMLAAALTGTRTDPTAAPFTDQADQAVQLRAPELPGFVDDLVLWLDAADESTLFADTLGTTPATTGQAVALWTDKSPSGNDALQTDPAGRPTLDAESSGNVPVFDGADSLALTPGLLPTGTTPSTVFVVARLDAVSGQYSALSHGGGAPGSDRFYGSHSARSRYITANSRANPMTTAWPAGGPGLLTGRFTGTGSTIWPDGGASSDVSGSVVTGSSFARVGGYLTGMGWRGSIQEILVFDRELPDAERRSLEEYLAAKWSLPLAPTAPSGLAVTATGDRSLTATWSAPAAGGGSPIEDYVVAFRAQGAGTWTTLDDGTSTATTATIAGLTTGTTYEVRVQAVNATGASEASEVATAQALALWTPADLSGGLGLWLDADAASTLSAPGGVVSEWRDRSGNARHATQASAGARPVTATDAASGRTVVRFTNPSTAAQWLDLPALAPIGAGTMVSVQRSNGDPDWLLLNQGNNPYSWVASSTIGPGVGSVTHGLGNPTFFADGDAVTWTLRGTVHEHVGNGPSIVVAVGASLSAWTSTARLAGYPASSWPFNGDVPELLIASGSLGTADRQRVEGYLAHKWALTSLLPGNHPYKNVPPLTATPAAPPAAPTGLTVTPGNGQLSLSWTAPAGSATPVRDYVVEYRPTSAGGAWTVVPDGVAAATTATVSGLVNGTGYDVRVSAVSAAGTGAAVSGTGTPIAPPTAPGAPTVMVGNGRLDLVWTAPASDGGAAVSDYVVEYRTAPSGAWTTVADGTSTRTAASVTGLTNDTAYEVRVSAVNTVGTGDWSATAAGTPLSLWTPADATGVAMWLDAADVATTVLTTGGVSEWRDRTANARNLTPPAAANRPSYVADGFNGRPTLRFDGTDDHLGSRSMPRTGDLNVIAVLRPQNKSGAYHNIFDNGSSSPMLWVRGGSPAWELNTGAGLVSTNAWAGVAQVVAAQVRTTTTPYLGIWVNGTADGSNNGQRGTSTNPSTFSFFHRSGGQTFLGDASELVWIDGTLTDADRQRIEGYLAHKWGLAGSLPAGHPYKESRPMLVPAAPAGLSLTGAPESLQVSWAAPANIGTSAISDYVVQYRVAPSGAWTTFADGVSTTTSAVVSGLASGTTYDVRVAAVNAAGTGAWSSTASATLAAYWTPANLAGGTEVWFDAALPSTITSSVGLVTEWRDRTGNGITATAPTSADRPAVGATRQNGRDVLSFAGAQELSAGDVLDIGGGGFELWTVASIQGTSGHVAGKPWYGAATGRYGIFRDGGQLLGNVQLTDGMNHLQAPVPNTTTAPQLIGMQLERGASAVVRVRVDGSVAATGTFAATSTVFDHAKPFRIGRYDSGWIPLTGWVGEVLAVRTNLSDADRARLEGYLAHKWGLTANLPADHPYRSAPPMSVPSAPSAAAAASGDGRLELSWSAPADDGGSAVTDYVVQHRTSPSGTWTTFADGVSSAATATLTGLVNGTTYDVRVAAANARGTGAWSPAATGTPAGPWTPADLATPPEWWLDATAGVTAPAGTVTEWANRSAAGGSLTVPSGSTGPSVEPAAINGLATVRFTADLLTGPDRFGGSSEDFTAVLVLRERVRSNPWFINLNGNSFDKRFAFHAPYGGTWYFDAGDTGGNRSFIGGSPTAVGTVVLGTFWKDQSLARNGFRLHPGGFSTQSSGWSSAITSGGIRIGQDTTDHDLAEFVAVDRRLTADEEARLEGYLAWKWGIAAGLPADHAYRDAPPTR